ncbi:MAG TPA: hypothetical protein VFS92_05720 [Planctomycetota bacterium]|nr:hypothetical protein [Planctomycetota bacterium]
MRLVFLAPLLAGCVSFPAPAPPLDEPVPVAVEGEYLHEPSGARFPERVESFRRVKVTRYDAGGRNVGVGYNLRQGLFAVAATAYVYPRPAVGSFLANRDAIDEWTARRDAEELRGCRQAVLDARREDGVRVVSEEPCAVETDGRVRRGTRVEFEHENALGTPGLRGTTLLYLFADGAADWFVKFRFTHPRGADCARAIDSLFRGLRWPGP